MTLGDMMEILEHARDRVGHSSSPVYVVSMYDEDVEIESIKVTDYTGKRRVEIRINERIG